MGVSAPLKRNSTAQAQPWKANWPHKTEQNPLQQMYGTYKKGEKMLFAGNGGGGGKSEIQYDSGCKPSE